MKKLLITSLFLSTALFAEAQVYVGILGGIDAESVGKPYNKNVSSPVGKLQIGYGDIKNYSVQLGFLYDKNTQNVFSTGTNDKEKYSMDVELIKAFDLGWKLSPFLKAGFGAGYFNTDINYGGTSNKTSLNFSSYNAGAGIYYPLSTHFNLEAGATYKAVSYQQIDSTSSDKGTTSKVIFSYAGIDYRF
jgi:opacity protein-like surface antigen